MVPANPATDAPKACARVGEAAPVWRSPAISSPTITVARPANRPAATVAVDARNPPCWVAPVSTPPSATALASRMVPGEVA